MYLCIMLFDTKTIEKINLCTLYCDINKVKIQASSSKVTNMSSFGGSQTHPSKLNKGNKSPQINEDKSPIKSVKEVAENVLWNPSLSCIWLICHEYLFSCNAQHYDFFKYY